MEKESESATYVQQQIDQFEHDSQQFLANRKGFHFPKWQFKSTKQATWVIAIFACIGGLLSGLDQSSISGANLYMPNDLGLDSNEQSLVTSFVPLGAVLGSLLISPTNEWLGRRYALFVSIFFYTVGGILEAAAVNPALMLAGRFVLGIGLGLEGGTVPIYVAECVPAEARGGIVSLYQMNIALGEVIGYAVAAMFVNVPSGNWRYMLGSSLVFSTIMLVGLLFLPETPRWLMHKNRYSEAFLVWKNLRKLNDNNSKIEFVDMMNDNGEQSTTASPLAFFTNRRARNGFIHANVMIALGQLTGINAIMFNMSALMNEVGFDSEKAVFMSLVGGGALLLGTIPGVLYMDKFGRRFWGNVTLPLLFVGLILVGVSYQFSPKTDLSKSLGLYLPGIIIYNAFFGSYACLTWVVPSESYPTSLRSYGMTVSAGTMFLYSFIVTYNFDRMKKGMTSTGLFIGFYGGIAVLGFVYQILFMPETKGKTLEQLDELFDRPLMDLIRLNWSKVSENDIEQDPYHGTTDSKKNSISHEE